MKVVAYYHQVMDLPDGLFSYEDLIRERTDPEQLEYEDYDILEDDE